MKLLTLLLLLALPDHSIVTQKKVTLYDYTDYSPIIIWNLSTVDAIPTPADEDLQPGDKCPTCKGTGTYVSGDGIVKKPCEDCGRDGTLDEGDPLLSSLFPEKIIELPEVITNEEREQETQEKSQTEERSSEDDSETQDASKKTEESPLEWKEKIPPLSVPEEAQVETKKVWTFNYQGTQFYYYPQYDLFVSATGTKYKVNLTQAEWIKERLINICTYDSAGNLLTCTNCPLTEIEVPISQLNYKPVQRPTRLPSRTTNDGDVSEYATPQETVERALSYLNLSTSDILLDVGSGDGRVAITAAKNYGCRAYGIEFDPSKIQLARENATKAGVAHLVTFIHGDFTKVQWPKATAGYLYLFPEELAAIKPKITNLRKVISFAHQVPGLTMSSLNQGEFYTWNKPQVLSTKKPIPVAIYNGRAYTRPVCNRPGCTMCAMIRSQLAAQGGY